jgi:hypothetical protein
LRLLETIKLAYEVRNDSTARRTRVSAVKPKKTDELFALAYNLGNFFRQAVLPKPIRHWGLTTMREKLIKIGAKVVSHARYTLFQMAELAVSKELFAAISWQDRAAQGARFEHGVGRWVEESLAVGYVSVLKLREGVRVDVRRF